jgi:hypothetical protein
VSVGATLHRGEVPFDHGALFSRRW